MVECSHTSVSGAPPKAILAMSRVKPAGHKSKSITVFFDGGSNTSFIIHEAAGRLRAPKSKSIPLSITKVESHESEVFTCEIGRASCRERV